MVTIGIDVVAQQVELDALTGCNGQVRVVDRLRRLVLALLVHHADQHFANGPCPEGVDDRVAEPVGAAEADGGLVDNDAVDRVDGRGARLRLLGDALDLDWVAVGIVVVGIDIDDEDATKRCPAGVGPSDRGPIRLARRHDPHADDGRGPVTCRIDDVVAQGVAGQAGRVDLEPHGLALGANGGGAKFWGRHIDHGEDFAFGIEVVVEHGDGHDDARTDIDRVGLGDGRIVLCGGLGDGDDDGRLDRRRLAVADRVAEGAPGGPIVDEDAEALVEEWLDAEAGARGHREVDDADDVAVRVAVVGQHIDKARVAKRNDNVVTQCDRWLVADAFDDLDTNLCQVAVFVVARRVAEHVGAGLFGDHHELAVGADGREDVGARRGEQFGTLSHEQFVAVRVGVVGKQGKRDRLAGHRRGAVVASVGRLVRVA